MFILKRNQIIWFLIASFAQFSSSNSSDEDYYNQSKCLPDDEDKQSGYVYFDEDTTCYRLHWQGPCKENQILFEDSKNRGVCDCEHHRRLIYSKKTDECYTLNTQGPCKKGRWFVLSKNGRPICKRVPQGCPADGSHVFASISPSEKKKCWPLGRQGPCEKGHFLAQNEGSQFSVFCEKLPPPRPEGSNYHYSVAWIPPHKGCPNGSRRSQTLGCKSAW